MEKILKEIKSVPGIAGTMVLAKETLLTYHRLPVSFTPNLTKQVGSRLHKLAQKMPPNSRLDLKFENGIGLVYNLDRSAVLIFGQLDLDYSFLGLVLKSALQSIERMLELETSPPEQERETAALHLDRTNLDLLIEAINLVATGYAEKQGTWWVTRNLRKAKEQMIREFPQISNFYVDNQGKVSIVKSQKDIYDHKIPLALVKWIDLFVNQTPHPSPRDRVADVKKLTAHISQPLEGIGFYALFTKIAKKSV